MPTGNENNLETPTTETNPQPTQPTTVEYDYEAPNFDIPTEEAPSVDELMGQYRAQSSELERVKQAYIEQQARMERLLGEQLVGKNAQPEEAMVDPQVYESADPATRKILDYIQQSTGLVSQQEKKIAELEARLNGVQKETKQQSLQRYDETVNNAIAAANERLGGQFVLKGAVLEEMQRSGVRDPQKAAMAVAAHFKKQFDALGVVYKRERKADPAPMINGAYMPQTLNQPEWKTPNPNSLESLKARSAEIKEWLMNQSQPRK